MPAASFIPYFPDARINRSVGEFRIWNWWNYRDKMVNDSATRAFLDGYFGLFTNARGHRERRIAVISPLNGDPFPTVTDFEIQSRIANALLASYLFNLPATNSWLPFCSSDNFTGLYQRFNPSGTDVAFTFGSYFKMTVAGSREHLRFATPQFVPDMDGVTPIDEMLVPLGTFVSATTVDATRLFRSIEWLRTAFLNYEGFQPSFRAVTMCTAFETLLDLPDIEKKRRFSEAVNNLLPPNQMPKIARTVGNKTVTDNAVGWWCGDFYELRSRIIHGEMVTESDFLYGTTRTDLLRLALYLFEECIWGFLQKWGIITQDARYLQFVWRSHWRDPLGVRMEDFNIFS